MASLKRQVEQTTASLEEAEKSRAEAKAAYDAAEAAVQEANAYAVRRVYSATLAQYLQ